MKNQLKNVFWGNQIFTKFYLPIFYFPLLWISWGEEGFLNSQSQIFQAFWLWFVIFSCLLAKNYPSWVSNNPNSNCFLQNCKERIINGLLFIYHHKIFLTLIEYLLRLQKRQGLQEYPRTKLRYIYQTMLQMHTF